MTRLYSHMFLKSMNLHEVDAEFRRSGTILEIHSAGDGLVGRESQDSYREEVSRVPKSQVLLNNLQ